ncbi:uncharacterized protein LOC101164237 [Oryzias latipes]|uniref:uncharacterized protein LOC101164237 n=1 Tax=Oryzias latipes TaxID=8090 RepID=UPI0002A4C3D4|nr:uncharacterized protein LOC101164237 [Oryzias latipes]
MSELENMRLIARQRLNAALEEILSVFENTILKYEREAAQSREVISRQHALLCKLHQPSREWDAPLIDCLTQQMLSGKEAAPCQPKDQIPDQENVLMCAKEEQQKVQLRELHKLEIIGFTYHSKQAAKPLDALQSPAQPQTLNSDQEVQTVLSSETEDSDDYNKEAAAAEASSNKKSFKSKKTLKTHRVLLKHLKSHQQKAKQVCGLSGEECSAGDDLTRHLQTHFEKRRTRSHDREKKIQERFKVKERGVKESRRRGKREKTNNCSDQGQTQDQTKPNAVNVLELES